jgi:hypothetical protein
MTTAHLENELAQLRHLTVKYQADLLIERLIRMRREKGDKLTRTDLENTITDTVGEPRDR